MADTVHVVEEKIVYTSEGLREAVQGVDRLTLALQSLEEAQLDAASFTEEDLDNLREMKKLADEIAKAQKQKAKDDEKTSKATEKTKDGAEGVFEVYDKLRRSAFWQFIGALSAALLKAVDGLTATNREMASLIQSSGHLSTLINRGMEPFGEGLRQLGLLSGRFTTIAANMGLTETQALSLVRGFQEGGIAFDRYGDDFKKTASSAVDLSFQLYGSMDKMGDVISFQTDLMDRFGMSLDSADGELRALGMDARNTSIANDRFLGAVKDISGELDMYGGSIKTVSGLLAEMSRTTGAARAIQDAKTLTSALTGLTTQQKNFIVSTTGGIPALEQAVQGQIKAAKAQLEAAQGDKEAEKMARDRLRRAQLAAKGLQGPAVSPYAVEEGWRVLGTQGQLLKSIDAAVRVMTRGRTGAGDKRFQLAEQEQFATMAQVVGLVLNLQGDQAMDVMYRLARLQEDRGGDLASIIGGLTKKELGEITNQQDTAESRAKTLVQAFETISAKMVRKVDEVTKILGPAVQQLSMGVNRLANLAEEFLKRMRGESKGAKGAYAKGAREFVTEGNIAGLAKAGVGLLAQPGEAVYRALIPETTTPTVVPYSSKDTPARARTPPMSGNSAAAYTGRLLNWLGVSKFSESMFQPATLKVDVILRNPEGIPVRTGRIKIRNR